MRIDTLGQYNLEARLEYKQVSPSRWKDTFAVGLSKQFPGVRVDSVQISDLQDFNVPVQLNVAFTVENYAEPVGNNHLMFPLPNDEFSDYAEIFAAAERQYPLDLRLPDGDEENHPDHFAGGVGGDFPEGCSSGKSLC